MDREQFARDNIRLIDYFLDYYHIKYKEDEIKDLLYIAFTQALNDYDPTKGKFTTFAMEYMRRLYFRELRVNKYPKRDTRGMTFLHLDADASMGDEDTPLVELIADPNVNVERDTIEGLWKKDTVANIVEVARNGRYPAYRGGNKVLTKKQVMVFESIYVDGLSRSQTAKKLHLKVQSVDLIDKLIIRRLSAWFRNSGANKSHIVEQPEFTCDEYLELLDYALTTTASGLVCLDDSYFELLNYVLVDEASGLVKEDEDYDKEIIKGSK